MLEASFGDLARVRFGRIPVHQRDQVSSCGQRLTGFNFAACECWRSTPFIIQDDIDNNVAER